MSDTPEWSPRDPKIVRHIEAIHGAGSDPQAFADALEKVRDDPGLTTAQRDAIFKTLAQDAAQAYFVFATGEKIDLAALLGTES